MTHQLLEKLQRLGGKVVVELTLNSGRRALGFVDKADSDFIVLCPLDNAKVYKCASYRTPQVRDFIRLDPGEAVSFEHNPPPPGTCIVIRYDNAIRACGYALKNGDDSITLAREILGDSRNKRTHQHLRDRITSTYVLKPSSDAS
jgi:hypothetical protein